MGHIRSRLTTTFFQQGVIGSLSKPDIQKYYAKPRGDDGPKPKFVYPGTSTVADAETLDSPFRGSFLNMPLLPKGFEGGICFEERPVG
jgi:hypothetical protein